MKNADQPIYPTLMQRVGEDTYRASKPNDPKLYHVACAGLTKREYFAAMAMQGILSNSTLENDITFAEVVRPAVSIADALLKELNGEQ